MSQDEYMEKVNRQRRKEQMEQERHQAIKDRVKFEELKSRYLGLSMTDGEIEIHSIDNIDDYYEIGERNHICCGTAKYFLNAVTDEQKSIRVHDFNRRISKNSKEICESLGIQCVTPQYARNSFISALAHHGVMTAYIDYAVGYATS